MNKFLVLKEDEKINVQAADIEAAAAENVSLSTYLNNKYSCLLYTSPSPRDTERFRIPSSA